MVFFLGILWSELERTGSGLEWDQFGWCIKRDVVSRGAGHPNISGNTRSHRSHSEVHGNRIDLPPNSFETVNALGAYSAPLADGYTEERGTFNLGLAQLLGKTDASAVFEIFMSNWFPPWRVLLKNNNSFYYVFDRHFIKTTVTFGSLWHALFLGAYTICFFQWKKIHMRGKCSSGLGCNCVLEIIPV